MSQNLQIDLQKLQPPTTYKCSVTTLCIKGVMNV
jgi:hypothetical protein